MFTVVIAEQEHINNIEKYDLFLKPFADKQHTKILRWNREGRSFRECIPGLEDVVVHHKEWRAVVLCGQESIGQKNPFDIVACDLPKKPENADDGTEEGYELLVEYYRQVRETKFAAYEQAIKRPLTRLMTYLCEPPLATGGFNHELSRMTGEEMLRRQGFEDEDYQRQKRKLDARQLEYQEYVEEAKKKEKLRKALVGSELCDIIHPRQVICIALRTKDVQEHDLKEQWKPHVNHQYNRFYDWNLYFDKMRYLVFDILPRENKRYEVDYLRFLSSVMLFANNELPPDGLRPNLVYSLNCHHDDQALEKLLLEYDAKLTLTDEMLERSAAEQAMVAGGKLSDSEVERIFCADVNVPVSTNADFDRSGLYASSNGIGLSSDCPGSEYTKWEHEFAEAKYTLGRFLKQPRRALQKSVDTLHGMSLMPADECARLDDFQVEEIAEHVYDEELAMIDTPTRSVYDVDRYYKRMDDVNAEVENQLEKRMTRKRTVALGLTTLLVYLTGFVPMLAGNIRSGNTGLAMALAALSLLLLATVAMICLCCLRWELVRLIRKFNLVMREIESDIDAAMTQFSRYLSHACGVMRGYSVLSNCREADKPGQRAVRLIRKHQQDIRRQRAAIRETFGGVVLQWGRNPELATQQPYGFDFTKMKDYVYPMPYREALKRKVEFIQSGNMIEAPVNFIDRIEVRLEELYD